MYPQTNERHHASPPRDEKGSSIMNGSKPHTTSPRRFALRAALITLLATAAGCTTERLVTARGDGGGVVLPRTSPSPHDTIAPATSECEAFGCTP